MRQLLINFVRFFLSFQLFLLCFRSPVATFVLFLNLVAAIAISPFSFDFYSFYFTIWTCRNCIRITIFYSVLHLSPSLSLSFSAFFCCCFLGELQYSFSQIMQANKFVSVVCFKIIIIFTYK